jgi:DNA polymerase elongation subunit (family B)
MHKPQKVEQPPPVIKQPKILFLDIESTPLLSWTWGTWKQNVIDIEKQSYLLSFAYKWQGHSKSECCALCDYQNEHELVCELWSLFDTADVIIAHNGDKFDIKKSNARFIAHGLKPPSPYISIDTLKIARKYFAFASNKLSDLSTYLKAGKKLEHTGIGLWFECMNPRTNKAAWKLMREYNIQDVALLEKVYEKLRPWHSSHPNLSWFTRERACPACHSSEIIRSGFRYLRSGIKQRLTCKSCGHHFAPGSVIKHDSFSWWE